VKLGASTNRLRILSVGSTKVSFPLSRDKGISYCRMLLHDTMLNDDSHRTGTSVTPLCEYGLERETVEHFAMQQYMMKSEIF